MDILEKKVLSFRLDGELVGLMNTINEQLGDKYNPSMTVNEYMKTLFLSLKVNSGESVENTYNSELIERINILENTIDIKERLLIEKDVEIREITAVANENARIATGLKLQLDNPETVVNNENALFSEENRFKMWCLLKLFQLQKPEFTFENMIIYVFSAFENSGYLKATAKDKVHLETIKGEYNGTLK